MFRPSALNAFFYLFNYKLSIFAIHKILFSLFFSWITLFYNYIFLYNFGFNLSILLHCNKNDNGKNNANVWYNISGHYTKLYDLWPCKFTKKKFSVIHKRGYYLDKMIYNIFYTRIIKRFCVFFTLHLVLETVYKILFSKDLICKI